MYFKLRRPPGDPVPAMPAAPSSLRPNAASWQQFSRNLFLSVVLLANACSPQSASARAAPESLAPLVKKVLPAVVNIAITETVSGGDMLSELPPELRDTPLGREFRRRFGNKREQVAGAGSGFIIDPSGIIVTNNHVVDHADKIVVSLTDGRQLPATVIGRDELTDIAVIKVHTNDALPSVPWGDSRKTEVGDWIMAAGNPFGLGGSVSVGIISAEGRDLGSGPFDNFLQLDAPINPGNSGGPVFNMDGAVIGVSSVIVSPTAPRSASASPSPARRSAAPSRPAYQQRQHRTRLARRVGGGPWRWRHHRPAGPQRTGGEGGYPGGRRGRRHQRR